MGDASSATTSSRLLTVNVLISDGFGFFKCLYSLRIDSYSLTKIFCTNLQDVRLNGVVKREKGWGKY
jgi:hypothetical protein